MSDLDQTEAQTDAKEKKVARAVAYQDVKMYLANDWTLKEETPEYFLLGRNQATTGGHILVACLTIWWTAGLGNLVYWLMNRKKKKILK